MFSRVGDDKDRTRNHMRLFPVLYMEAEKSDKIVSFPFSVKKFLLLKNASCKLCTVLSKSFLS